MEMPMAMKAHKANKLYWKRPLEASFTRMREVNADEVEELSQGIARVSTVELPQLTLEDFKEELDGKEVPNLQSI
uniref:Reverse transcriptase domain-containing protein n=1 Tax=Rhabditophanes sp. KR3021 TaxID=114890 RepID=A0AC35UC77_9BILA